MEVSAAAMRRFMQQTNGDVVAAARLALAEMEKVRQQGFRITQMRQGPVLPPGGLRPPSPPTPPGGFTTLPGGGTLPGGITSPDASRNITRVQGAALALAFTLGNLGEQLAAAETKWQKLDRTIGTAAQTIATVAVFFGPAGLLVAGVAVAANALSSFWTQQREEAARAAKELEEYFKRLRKGGIGGAAEAAQERFSGVGGVLELRRQIEAAEAERARIIAEQRGRRTTVPEQREAREAHNRVRELRRQLDEVAALHAREIGIVNELAAKEGQRAQTAMQVAEWQKQTPEAVRERTVQETQRLLALERGLIETGQSIGDVHEKILRNQATLNDMLDQEIDKRSTVALQLRQMLVDIQKADVLDKVLRTTGALPLPAIGTMTQPMQKPEIEIPQLEVLPFTLAQELRLAFQPLVDTVKQMGGYLLSAGLGMLSQYGGAGGQALAGIIGGAQAGSKWGVTGGVIGGLVGAADALMSLGRSAREARKAFMEFLQAQEMFILQQRLALGDITQAQFDAEMLRRQFAEQREPLERRVAGLTRSREEALRSGSPLALEAVAKIDKEIADLMARIDELNELERRQLDNLNAAKDALNEMTEAAERFRNVPSWFKVELETWRAANAIGSGAAPDLARPGRRGTGGGVTIGRIVINTAETNGRKLFDQILSEARRRAAAVHGAGATDVDLLDLG